MLTKQSFKVKQMITMKNMSRNNKWKIKLIKMKLLLKIKAILILQKALALSIVGFLKI